MAQALLPPTGMANQSPTTSRDAARGRRWALPSWALFAAALLALLGTVALGARIGRTRCALSTHSAPHAMISLQLARSAGAAAAIVAEWRAATPRAADCPYFFGQASSETARKNLVLDNWFVVAYVATLVLASLAVLPRVTRRRGLVWALAGGAVAAGLCDLAENALLVRLLSVGVPADIESMPHAVQLLRLCAQVKYVLLLAVVLCIVTCILACARRWWLALPIEPPRRRAFFELMLAEANGIIAGRRRAEGGVASDPASDEAVRERLVDPTPKEERATRAGDDVACDTASAPDGARLTVAPASSDEPWVSFRTHDVVGLALSGGGIRSATFNLGLLGGLEKLDVLRRIDLLSTVSGGGYVGGFWTAWLHNQPGQSQPRAAAAPLLWPPRAGVESGPVRHLREFSRFLAARRGFFEAEMWEAIVAVLAGVLTSFLTASSVIGLALVGWLAANFFLACPDPGAGIATAVALSVAVTYVFREGWAVASPADQADLVTSKRVDRAITVVALVGAIVVEYLLHDQPLRVWSGRFGWSEPSTSSYATWWLLTGIERAHPDEWFWSPRLYDLALVWLAPGVLLLAGRAFFTLLARREQRDRVWVGAFDRVVMRFLGSAVGWAAIATLWHVSINFLPLAQRMIAIILLSGGSFVALRNWIGVALRSGSQASALDRFKPYLPEILAYLTVALLVAGVGSVLIEVCGSDWLSWYLATGAMGLAIVAMLVLDPAEIGLHSFYRDRIVRAYPGASNPDSNGRAQSNRQTNRRTLDDLPLEDLPERPLHLICCAANDLSGDPIETLGRGARSATLSRNGIAVANGAWPPGGITLGGAITASAAAFNSNMGSISMSVGPVVAFLMAALNLRLGLWVPNPRRREQVRPRLLPGVLFFREMFALTIADREQPEVHLSDGAHFENLALYELVRRHCRYVIVSDCGEDPSVAFDDFGNAARRIREDFGVQIDIDLSALRPDEARRSRQHAVVGTIHYTDFDKGILLYVKPTLTGDEPPDVLQHATRNRRFPHEPTSDQFYDEAQWESYRQLGEHTACSVFGFVDRYPGSNPTADWIFTTARQEWYPTPHHLPRRVREMTERFGLAESELQRQGAVAMLNEVFPEVDLLHAPHAAGSSSQSATSLCGAHEHAANLACLLRVMQLMEDVWASCELDAYWNHPLNLGWVNCFARWTSAPTFRMWWSLLRPMYGAEFQRFLQERFPILDSGGAALGTVFGPQQTIPDGLAAQWWRERHAAKPDLRVDTDRPKCVYGYRITLERPEAQGAVPVAVQVALVLVRRASDATAPRAWWSSDDFFVPPSLWGSGLGGAFLHGFLDAARAEGLRRLDVFVKAPAGRNDPGSWSNRVSYVEFYKKQGFRIVGEVGALPDGESCRAVHLQRGL